ncbi:MAG: hypothetical protein ABIP65_11405 [Vicinamibacterales bacterium]
MTFPAARCPTIRLLAATAVTVASMTGVSLSQAPVEVRTALSRTAAWIGDRVTYTVELESSESVGIVDDDLAPERLRVEGGEIVGFETRSDERHGRRVRRWQYTLASSRIDVAEIRIAAVSVRHYARTAGGTATPISPSGQVIVPPAVVAIRSSLPSTDRLPPLRVPSALEPAPVYLPFAVPVGLVLMAVVIVPLLFAGVDLSGRARLALAARRSRRLRQVQTVSLDGLRTSDPSSDAERVLAYGRLDALIRDHVHLTTGAPAIALAPPELRQLLERIAPHLPHEAIESLLTRCEDAKYAPTPPSRGEWSSALSDAELILRPRRR